MINEIIENNIVHIYTTCSNEKTAGELSIAIIKERLAISVDYWQTKSVYPWNGVIKEINQFILMLSTTKKLSKNLLEYLKSIHPYSTPVINTSYISLSNSQYNHWLNSFFTSRNKYLTELEFKIKKEHEESTSLRLK